YLYAEVYSGTPHYADALTAASDVITSGLFTLESNYRHNFTSDNNASTEVLFAAIQDGSHTQTWAGMTFLVHAARWGSMDATYFNLLRERAFGDARHDITAGQMTLDTILAERGRELLFEARRRTDLIRFGLFTGVTYLWAWKGNDPGGIATDSKYNLYAIPRN